MIAEIYHGANESNHSQDPAHWICKGQRNCSDGYNEGAYSKHRAQRGACQRQQDHFPDMPPMSDPHASLSSSRSPGDRPPDPIAPVSSVPIKPDAEAIASQNQSVTALTASGPGDRSRQATRCSPPSMRRASPGWSATGVCRFIDHPFSGLGQSSLAAAVAVWRLVAAGCHGIPRCSWICVLAAQWYEGTARPGRQPADEALGAYGLLRRIVPSRLRRGVRVPRA